MGFSDLSDSDDDDPIYGSHKKATKVLGEHWHVGLEIKDVSKWIVAIVTMVEQFDWPSNMARKFRYCPCSRHTAGCCRSNFVYACHYDLNSIDGHSEKYCNCSKDHSPNAASFKLEAFIGNCKEFSVRQKCPLQFKIHYFLRNLYGLKWSKDLNDTSIFKHTREK